MLEETFAEMFDNAGVPKALRSPETLIKICNQGIQAEPENGDFLFGSRLCLQ